jgi:hypothetical protein
MRAGVAQGGPASPVLFSLYVNDVPVHPATSMWPLRRRHGHHSQVPQVSAAYQVLGNLSE